MSVTVNGVSISEEKIAAEMARLRDDYDRYVRENGGEPSDKELREWAEEDLIESELFRQTAAAKFPEPSDERAKQFMAEYPEAVDPLPEGERLQACKEALRSRALMKELRKAVPRPTEAEIRRHYDEHPEAFAMPETLYLSHVCRMLRPTGPGKSDFFLELLHVKKAVEGGRLDWWEAVAHGSDTFQHDRGVFDPVVRGYLPQAIEDKLFALKPGEISDVVEFDNRSLHLFCLAEVKPPHTLPFKEVHEHIARSLFERACQTALEAKFDALKEQAVIRREP